MTVIKFPLDQDSDDAQLVYHPWGTRTIKIQISAGSKTPALRIRPKGIREAEAAAGLFRAFADDSDAFVISWGGGHEPGPCLKAEDYLMAFERCVAMEAGDASVLYFNLSHQGPDVPAQAAVTLEAYEEDSGDVFAEMTIQLRPPQGYTDNAVRFSPGADGTWTYTGERVAAYDPRWWPQEIEYGPLTAAPLQLQVAENVLSVQWDGETVATITDHTKPTVLTPAAMACELFDFDQWHLALRVWFFWLDTRIGGGHEVPDAERFDMLLRKKDGFITLACTDMHWREMWAQIDGAPMRATLGLSGSAKLKLVTEGVHKVAAMFKREKDEDHSDVYNPVAALIPRQAQRLGQVDKFDKRGKGLEAHIPTIENVVPQKEGTLARMTSSDVRLG